VLFTRHSFAVGLALEIEAERENFREKERKSSGEMERGAGRVTE
jgi:hypothetical protein